MGTTIGIDIETGFFSDSQDNIKGRNIVIFRILEIYHPIGDQLFNLFDRKSLGGHLRDHDLLQRDLSDHKFASGGIAHGIRCRGP